MAEPKADDGLQDVFQGVLDSLGSLPGVIGQLGGVVSKLTSALTSFLSSASNIFTATATASLAKTVSQPAPAAATGPLTAALERATLATTRLATMLERMFASAVGRQAGAGGLPAIGTSTPLALPPKGGFAAPPPPAGGGGGGAAAEAAGGMGGLAAVAGVAAAGIGALAVAVNLAEQQFQKVVGFVAKFNPGVVGLFQMALDNLSATIGSAFTPMVQAATQVVQRWTAVLAPVMQALAPVVQEVSNVFGNILVRVLTQIGAVLKASIPTYARMAEVVALVAEVLMPVFNVVSMVVRGMHMLLRAVLELSGLGTVLRVLSAAMSAFNGLFQILDAAMSILEVVVTSVADAFVAFVGSFLPGKDAMEALNRAIQWVVRSMYVLAVQVAKLVGAMSVADALIGSVEGKTTAGSVAAQQPQIKSLEQLSKDIAVAAAAAGGSAGPGGIKDEREFWTQTLNEMRAAKANGVSIKDLLEAIIRELRNLNPFKTSSAPTPGGGQVGPGGVPGSGWGATVGGLVGGIVGGAPGAVVGSAIGGRG